MHTRTAIVQMDIAFGDLEKNYETVKQNIIKAAKEHADVVVLPELWPTGYALTRLEELGDKEGKKSADFIAELAREYKINIVAGSVPKETSAGVTNTMFIFNRSGELVKEYSKAHLFRLMEEEKYLVEGNKDGLFELDGTKSAGVICYDIRFPEWIRTHMLDDTKVLYVVAEWPKPRTNHWRTLLISRAIENQCYVVACNRIGSDPNNEFGGHSIVINPWGDIVAEAEEDETILYAELDLEEVDKVREKIPVFTDRRPDLYKL
ncbi:carbon-nitrogen family hydrolase [Evansella sp. LMS18]|uniref:carbon-nitrogen family hydrolase n=1 Tax=Evansella sp. LMS18 TaxID=2924033 RepID=UPI0020D13875|nr:carbon-nitrogen family hydrolase [Evansella sp. LMS18]UTR10598.1 carbon-nitrogen family hydrolase [Evansella sp. LMS18]